ncbi:MAG: hypothetical protein HZB98_06880, partial [Bacteroidia bacterium]|nr:hypothetical protein [Bacteroidia bacterium]
MMVVFLALLPGCSTSSNKNTREMNKNYVKGTYGYDADFFQKHNIGTIELKDRDSQACLMLIPAWQGRVMTSSVAGNEGISFGWINYKFIEAGQQSSQFNPFGGEERLWLGPEGGPFSVYFSKGAEQVFTNWIVPKEIDTEPFEVIEKSQEKVSFRKNFTLVNASGSKMDIGIERVVKLLNSTESENALGISIDKSLAYVAYESDNTLTN